MCLFYSQHKWIAHFGSSMKYAVRKCSSTEKKGKTIYLDKTSKVRCNYGSKLSACHGTIDHDLYRASPIDMLISRPLKKIKPRVSYTKELIHEILRLTMIYSVILESPVWTKT